MEKISFKNEILAQLAKNNVPADSLTTMTEDEVYEALSTIAETFTSFPGIELIYQKMKNELEKYGNI